MNWIKPQYGPGRVDAAGKLLANRKPATDRFTLDDAVSISANWRSSHAYPLQSLAKTLRNRAKRIDPDSFTGQRLKRMPSIIAKLARFPNMQLSKMHDLGGCRAVVASIEHVRQLVALYKSVPCSTATFCREYDYISNPKPDGYRCVHLVYEYGSPHHEKSVYTGQKIEIQIRSQLQHSWSTAVETVDTLTRQALKSGIGTESWKRFFVLMGSFIAITESKPSEWVPGTLGDTQWLPIIPDSPEDLVDLVFETNTLCESLNVESTLGTLAIGMQTFPTLPKEAKYYILEMHTPEEDTMIHSFQSSVAAANYYAELEKQNAGNPSIQTVLVSVDSISTLYKAFPNYFNDTLQFLTCVYSLQAVCEENMREIIDYRAIRGVQ